MQTFCHIRGWYARLSDEGVQSPLTAKGGVNVQIILVQVQGRRAVQKKPSCLRVMCKTPFHVWGWRAKPPFMSECDKQNNNFHVWGWCANSPSCLRVTCKTSFQFWGWCAKTPFHVWAWCAKKQPFMSEGDVQTPLLCLRATCKTPLHVRGWCANPPFMSESAVHALFHVRGWCATPL